MPDEVPARPKLRAAGGFLIPREFVDEPRAFAEGRPVDPARVPFRMVEKHECEGLTTACELIKESRFGGPTRWCFYLEEYHIPVRFCPFCGAELPA